MIVSPEDGTASPLESPEEGGSGSVSTVKEPPMTLPDQKAVVNMLIEQALKGTMPITRALKPNEVRCFSPMHLNMVFDHVQGPLTNQELVEKYNVSASVVSWIVNHPYTDILRAALLGLMADKLTDPLERMRAVVHEMIDIKMQIVRDPNTPKRERNRIANDFLDRAGYGPLTGKAGNKGSDLEVPQLPAPIMNRFSEALEGAARVANLPWDRFTQRGGALAEGGSVEQSATSPKQAAEPVEANTSQGLPSDPASPIPSEKIEKVA